MQTTRRELLDDFLHYVNAYGDPTMRNQAETLLNRVIEGIWLKRGWRQFLDPTVYEVSTVANTRQYALPSYFGRVSGTNRTLRNLTDGARLIPKDRSDLEEMDPTVGTSLEIAGSPRAYAISGTMPVQVQPAATGEALEAISTSVNDTTVKVYLDGLDANGIETQSEVTLTGANPVALGTWGPLTAFGKAYPEAITATTELTTSEGSVTLRKVSDGTVLQKLAPWQSARMHQTLVLYPIPDQVYVIGVPILRAPLQTIRDADPLPAMWGNAIFEKMVLAWRVSDQNVSADGNDVWPALLDLMTYDNGLTAQAFQRRQPFMG